MPVRQQCRFQHPYSFLYHHLNQLRKGNLGMPAKFRPKLREIGACVTVIDLAYQRLVNLNVFGPVKPDNTERRLAKFRNRMALAGADDEVGCGLVFDNEMYCLNEVAGKSKITSNIDVAEIKLSSKQNW